MKKMVMGLIGLACFTSLSAVAADVAYVDLSVLAPKMQVVAEQKWKQKYGADAEKQAAKLKKDEAAFKQAVQDYQSKATLMSAAKKQQTEKALQSQQQKLQTEILTFQKHHVQQQQDISQQMMSEVKKQAAAAAKKQGVDLVVMKSSILFQGSKDELVDLTRDIDLS